MRPFRREPRQPGGRLPGREEALSAGQWRGNPAGLVNPRRGEVGSITTAAPAKMPKARRHRPWLRVVVALFIAIDIAILLLVEFYCPVFDSEVTKVYSEEGVVRVC